MKRYKPLIRTFKLYGVNLIEKIGMVTIEDKKTKKLVHTELVTKRNFDIYHHSISKYLTLNYPDYDMRKVEQLVDNEPGYKIIVSKVVGENEDG